MKVYVKEVPPAEPTYTVRLDLTKREFQLLLGLTDFPMWEEQSGEVNEFLVGLNSALTENGIFPWSGMAEPAVLGFAAAVNI
jgi:hypothetical protein